MAYVAGNKDPYLGDTSQSHESHTAAPSYATYVNSLVSVPKVTGPTTFGFKGWNFDPAFCSTATTHTAGLTWVMRVEVPGGTTISNVNLYCAGTGTLTDLQVGVYNSAGTQYASVTGQQARLAANTICSIPVSATITEDFCYVAWTHTGSVAPSFYAYGSSTTSAGNKAGLTNSRSLAVSASSVPSTLATAFSNGSQSTLYWVGVS